MIIREIDYKDYEQVLPLLEEFGENNLTHLEFNHLIQGMNDTKIFVGVIDEKVVGIHSVLIEQKLIHSGGKVAHFEDLIVSPEYRKQGIGQMLQENSVKYAKKEGCYKIIWNCSDKLIPYYKRILKGRVSTNAMRRDL